MSTLKRICVLRLNQFGAFFSLLPNFVFQVIPTNGVQLRIRIDGKLFGIICLRGKALFQTDLIKEFLFNDDAHIKEVF